MMNTPCMLQSHKTAALVVTSPALGSLADFHLENQAYNQPL